jgi:molybdopterin synthase catalytic subunit
MITITEDDFDVKDVIEPLRTKKVGAIVTFIGTVRDFSQVPDSEGKKKQISVEELTYESYDDMALEKMNEIQKFAISNYGINEMNMIHRKGTMRPSDKIVIIACSAAHRKDAFLACEYAIDELKKIVPIWKKEVSMDGEYWVGEESKE